MLTTTPKMQYLDAQANMEMWDEIAHDMFGPTYLSDEDLEMLVKDGDTLGHLGTWEPTILGVNKRQFFKEELFGLLKHQKLQRLRGEIETTWFGEKSETEETAEEATKEDGMAVEPVATKPRSSRRGKKGKGKGK
eukprot:TRINITY_DN3625_c2_g1_i1.p1 TRINITY_DN3625_c2_g1~~TRINITY_DN3625_c2_g1_i1.p1  ORF type:complete len:135 (-),score=38.83 TRINITY_DN3625_c2_g1_i1:72-476(-)